MGIDFQAVSFIQPLIKKRIELFSLIGKTILNCIDILTNQKEWLIYQVNEQTGFDLTQIKLNNNPTIYYAELVMQPKTLQYGLYRFEYSVKMTNTNSSLFSSQISTYVRIIPSGLALSSLSLSQGMYGGTIEISRGQSQSIDFNPYLNSYDVDSLLVITTLNFKYTCQIIDSNIESGYPKIPGTNTSIYMDDIKLNPSLQAYEICFNSTGFFSSFLDFVFFLDP